MSGSIARATLRTSAVLGIRLLLQAGTLLVVARMLGPHRFGAFMGVAATAVVLGTLSTLGTHLVLLGEVSRESGRRQGVLQYAVPTTLLCGGFLLAIFLLVCPFILRESSVTPAALLSIGIAEILLQPLFNFPAMEHLALGRTARSQLLTNFPLALRLLAAAVILLWRPPNVLSAYAIGYLLASVIALAIATLSMPAPWPAPLRWRLPSRAELCNSAGYAVLNVTNLGPTELDKTFAMKLLPLASAGVYAAGTRVIGAATLPVMAMMLSAMPRLFREGEDQPLRTALLLRSIFLASLGYSVLLATALWFFAPLFNWLFGAKFHGLELTVRWLCLAVPGMCLRIAAGSALMALGKPWMRAGFELAGLIVLLPASIFLTAKFGSMGMPFSLACSEWTMAVIGLLLIFGNRQRQTLWKKHDAV